MDDALKTRSIISLLRLGCCLPYQNFWLHTWPGNPVLKLKHGSVATLLLRRGIYSRFHDKKH